MYFYKLSDFYFDFLEVRESIYVSYFCALN